ncbi:LytTR family two component transcriptional regulator [Flammeovirgaceae bacterium 311]|nr:LytTR family two component transcriptional regulator [Flammeovirgaceae bacterium 311]
MNCLVVDDEPLARQLLESYIARVDGLVLVKSCANALEAFSILQHQPVDLLFLDIQMPLVTGIDLLKSQSIRSRVIFTTAYRDYAIEAYDLDVVDYLLKPIHFERFLKSIAKIYQFKEPFGLLEEHAPIAQGYEDAYIFLKENREMVKVFLKDILYIESLRDYVRVKTLDKQVISYQKISYLEQKLPENKFIRVHRSFIVALDLIKSFTLSSVRVGTLEIPIGRNYKTEVLKALNKNNILREDSF